MWDRSSATDREDTITMSTDTTRPSLWRRTAQWIRQYAVYPAIALLFVLFLVVLASNRIMHNISPGELGVLWSRFNGGTILDRTYAEGFRLTFPWDRLYVYNIRVQELHDSVTLLSSNGLPITVTYSCRYHPFPGTLPELHQRYGPEYAETLVRPEVISALRVVIGNYRPEDIYARDEAGLLDEIFTALQANLTNHDVVVQDVLIKELHLTPEIETAINEKLVQEQQALAYEFRLKLEEAERQRKTIEAQGIRAFEDTSRISILKWRGIEATLELAKSPNAKVIVVGPGETQMPIILGGMQ
jgi:regulator of protease activity HflC (stomatin/prohibitin superfamily)